MRSIEEKWEIARPYYEKAGQIAFRRADFRFKVRPSDAEIEMLYEKMCTLHRNYHNYVAFFPELEERLINPRVTPKEKCIEEK